MENVCMANFYNQATLAYNGTTVNSNITTGEINQSQCVLLRAGEIHQGPAKLTKYMHIDKRFNNESICNNPDIWIEDDGFIPEVKTASRVGIDYAGDYWKNIKWRFISNGGSK